MTTRPQSWEQPRRHSGWGSTLRHWGSALGPFAPLALGLIVPAPVAVAAAGTLLVSGTLATVVSLRRDPWAGFEPAPGEVFDPDAGELPEPALLSTLGLDGLRVDALLHGGTTDEEWMAFQTVDRLGGRTTRVVLPLPGRGRRVSMVVSGRRRTACPTRWVPTPRWGSTVWCGMPAGWPARTCTAWVPGRCARY